MAQTTEVIQRAERSLNAIHSFIDDLRDLAEEWETLEEWDRVSESLYWDHMMADYLVELDGFYNSSQLTKAQQSSYCLLIRRLKEVMPIITRLNWYCPPVSLDLS
ncbi:MAG: hypothetical protein EXR50_00535 [Dehalococcoidia bacterium]|nr:hypothetical protein [Dehalococcoidia bacterium]